jgi:hypothetical protein
MTAEEVRDRSTPGNPGFVPRVNAAGVYRDCRACSGWGKHTVPEGVAPCEFCEVTEKEDHERMALLDEKYLPSSDEGILQKQWTDSKQAVANIAAEDGPHFVYRCRQCDLTYKRPMDAGLGKWDRPSHHRIFCCEHLAHFVEAVTPELETSV